MTEYKQKHRAAGAPMRAQPLWTASEKSLGQAHRPFKIDDAGGIYAAFTLLSHCSGCKTDG